jgi:hypothetical protein
MKCDGHLHISWKIYGISGREIPRKAIKKYVTKIYFPPNGSETHRGRYAKPITTFDNIEEVEKWKRRTFLAKF